MFKSIRNRLTALALVGLVAAGSAGRLEAAGFALFEQGSKGNAAGGAFAATADDPSAMFFNPAGNAFIDHFTLEAGGFAILRPTARLDGLSPSPFFGAGYSASMSKSLYGIGHGYGVLPLSDSVKLSVGFWSPNGLGVPWENPNAFAGRYISQRTDLRQLAVSAQLAVKLSDWVAIGAGPEVRLTDVRLSRNVPSQIAPGKFVDVAHVSIVSDGTPVDLGFAAGLLVKPCERVRLGISYHSHMDVDLEGPAQFGQILAGNAQFDGLVAQGLPGKGARARTTIQFPSVTMFGIAYELTPNLTIEADGNYTTWSVFDQTVLHIDGIATDTILKHGWENTWAFRAGLTYKMGSSWVAGGFVYDQTPQPDSDVGPFLPDANRTGGTIGAGIAVSKHFQFQVSSLFLWFHERTITTNKDNFSATYQTFAILPSVTIKSTF